MKEKYMETLLAQIREKRAAGIVRREVEDHIEDQKETYLMEGMTETEAEEKAVSDMGDPVETGLSLDKVHRPRPAWGMLAAIAVLCIVGAVLQYAVYSRGGGRDAYYFKRQCFHAAIGFLVLCGVYLMDYTRIAKYSRLICTGILIVMAAAMGGIIELKHLHIVELHGSMHWVQFFQGLRVSIELIFYLYVPLCGAVLYHYRNGKKKDLWKILFYIAAPVCLAASAGVSLALNLTVVLLIMFSVAAAKGWYDVPKKKTILFVWGAALCIPLLFLLMYGSPYQYRRVQAWLNPSLFRETEGYVNHIIHNIISGSQLVGQNTAQPLDGYLPEMPADYLLTSLIGYYGVLAAAALIIFVLFLGVKLLRISIRQKNQLGMMMGLGCSLIFGIQSVEYILVNLGLLPAASIYFPLISYGGSGMLQTCILLGILLSIYRYQDVVSEPAAGQQRRII